MKKRAVISGAPIGRGPDIVFGVMLMTLFGISAAYGVNNVNTCREVSGTWRAPARQPTTRPPQTNADRRAEEAAEETAVQAQLRAKAAAAARAAANARKAAATDAGVSPDGAAPEPNQASDPEHR